MIWYEGYNGCQCECMDNHPSSVNQCEEFAPHLLRRDGYVICALCYYTMFYDDFLHDLVGVVLR